ncbi:peptidoglycan-binding protein [Lysobacter sp. K5869]|uniref:peptidoglycan-binding protein n=1 Tax=Lysobacter sp. K5869 TaxID=2820808 RepID=UPI001C0603C8|nr:peptidoglycan-binding protein [Lysobacter sp. K5869]QWP76104.1 peptidoglycan-binding protein [Lysobacter sp. K5869]
MNDKLQHTFELHHCIEQNNVFENSELLQTLGRDKLYNIDNPGNLVYLPDGKPLGAQLEVSPHVGGHLKSYTNVVVSALKDIEDSADWQSYLESGDQAAVQRVVQRVHHVESTIKTALVNGDLYTNNTHGLSNSQVRAINQDFHSKFYTYQETHAAQIAEVAQLGPPQSQWVSVLRTEQQALDAVQLVNRPGFKPSLGTAADGRASLLEAIEQAHNGGRLTFSAEGLASARDSLANSSLNSVQAEHLAPKPGGRAIAIKGIVAAAGAVSLAEAAEAGERISSALDRDNPLAAQSHAMHYGGRGVGGVAGGAAAGLIAGSWTGPGALITVAVGAYAGSEAGEKVAKWWDNRQVYHQTDRDNVSWEFTGRQWVRERTADLSRDGIDNPTVTTFAAPPEKARELNLAALNAATALELKDVPPPRSPFIQPQSPGDAPSLDPAPWERNSRTGQWERNVVVGRVDHGANDIRPEIASPQRAAALEQAANQVIRENIANGPAPIASRYEIAFRASGFDGDKLPAATTALAQGYVTASNGELYRRDDAGQWLSPNGAPAPGNLPVELERTNAELAPQLAQHRQYVAALSPMPAPAEQDRDRAILLDTYQQRGVNPTPEQMDASMLAISRTRDANGIAPGMTTFQLEPNADRGYDVRSPIAHVYGYADGVRRVAAVTTAPEIAQALTEVQARPAPVPDTPELRIEALSPQQREAQEQALREANRLGLSRDDVQLTAQQAAAAAAIAADREPEIVTRPIDADRAQAAPRQDAQPTPAPSSPAPSQPAAPLPPKAEPSADAAQVQARADEARKPVEPEQPAAEAQASPRSLPAQNDAQATPAPPSGQDDALRRGSEGQDVALLQYRLDRMGYRGPGESPLPQHGQFDAATEHGVRQFQEANRLPSTGVVDPDTVQALAVAQQTRAVRPASGVQREPDEPKTERETPARAYDEAPASVAPTPPPADRDDRAAPQNSREARRSEPEPSAPTQPGERAEQDRARRQDRSDESASIPEAPRADPERATPDARPSSPEPSPVPSIPPAMAGAPTPIEPATTPRHAAELADRMAPAPTPQPAAPEPEPAIDLSHFSRSDQAMIAKIRANVPGGLSDEHAAAAMLAAKCNGIQDVDRLGPVALVGDTLWMGGKVEGFHTAIDVSQQAPPLQDTVRETEQFNYEQTQKQAQEQAQQQQQQQNQEQTDKALKMSLM